MINKLKLENFKQVNTIIIASRPGVGKSSLARNIAQEVLDRWEGVVIFSLERGNEDVFARMLSARTSIPLKRLISENMYGEEWEEFTSQSHTYSNQNLFFEDEDVIHIELIEQKLRKLKAQHEEISLCIIDYIQLLASSSQSCEMSKRINLLAKELQITIMITSQLARNSRLLVSGAKPKLSDIREKCYADDADIVMLLSRDGKDAVVDIAKHSMGKTGMVKISFDVECLKFSI